MPPKDWTYLVTCRCGTFYTNTNTPTKCDECEGEMSYQPALPPVAPGPYPGADLSDTAAEMKVLIRKVTA